MELAGIQIAVIVVTISIIISGIALGLGRALGYRNVERFGVEELFQSIVNAAIIGAAVVIIETITAISSSLVAPVCSGTGDAIAELSCVISGISDSTFVLLQETLRALNTVGYYQTMVLEFGSFSIQPFANLGGISSILSSQALTLNALLVLVSLNAQILSFFSQSALALFFPLGLILRSFFATRRVGGFLIGIAIGLYVFYPSFVLAFPAPDLSHATAKLESFNSNPFYATMPILDLSGNYAIASRMDNMSAMRNVTVGNESYVADLSGELTVLAQANANAISNILLYAVIAPIFSLIITIIFIREMATALSSEVQFKVEVV